MDNVSIVIDPSETGMKLDLINRALIASPKYAAGLCSLAIELTETKTGQLDALLYFTQKGAKNRFFPDGV